MGKQKRSKRRQARLMAALEMVTAGCGRALCAKKMRCQQPNEQGKCKRPHPNQSLEEQWCPHCGGRAGHPPYDLCSL